MAPSPKRTPPRGRPQAQKSDDELKPLRADDPRPQRVPQYPSTGRHGRHVEEAIPTTIYDMDRQDEEFPPTYDPADVSDGGYRPAFLYVEKGPGTGQLLQVRQGPLVIGRASVSELRLQHPSISRRHAQLTRHGERFYIKDLGSQNGTFVNRVRLATEIEIFPGDEVSVGNAVIRLRGPMKAEATPPPAHVAVEPRPRARQDEARGPRTLTLVLLAGTVGFALAAGVMLVLLKFPRPSPEQPTARPVALTPPPAPEPKAAAPVTPPPPPAAIKEAEEVVDAKIAEVMQAREPEPRPAAERPQPAPKQEPAAAKSKPTHAAQEAARAEILKRYEDGSFSAALELARSAEDQEMVGKLTSFEQSFKAAEEAFGKDDAEAAVKLYERALDRDERISPQGFSKYAEVIRGKLSTLLLQLGNAALDAGERDRALQTFQKLVKLDPANAEAKQALAKLTASPAKPKSRPAKAKARDEDAPNQNRVKTRSAIDDAFEDG